MLSLSLKPSEWIDVTLPDGRVGSIQFRREGEGVRVAIDLPRDVLFYRSDIPIARRRGPLGYVPRETLKIKE
jgi:hypothetical protein